MDPKPRPNDEISRTIWRSLSVERRIEIIAELSDQTVRLFRAGLRKRFKDLDEEAFRGVFLQRLAQCHNSNY